MAATSKRKMKKKEADLSGVLACPPLPKLKKYVNEWDGIHPITGELYSGRSKAKQDVVFDFRKRKNWDKLLDHVRSGKRLIPGEMGVMRGGDRQKKADKISVSQKTYEGPVYLSPQEIDILKKYS